MKASQIISKLQQLVDEYGDGSVQCGFFSGEFETSEFCNIEDITIENKNNHYIVLWDTP